MGKYDHIMGMPHHEPVTRPRMPAENRAAQFAPFAALTGYDEAVDETARLTEARHELSETEASALDRKTAWLSDHITECPYVKVTYFVPDLKKEGGEYLTIEGRLKKMDATERIMTFYDGGTVRIPDIRDIQIRKMNE